MSKEQFEALLSERGIGNDDTVVLYGGNNNWFAAYAYWYFKLYGHDDVKLLDGGRKKWELDSRELVAEVVARPATTYTAKEQDRSIRAFRDEVEAAIGQKNLVDVRSPDEFAGRLLAPAHLPQEQSQRPGHIPTAANIPWSQAANDDGTFKSDDELTKLYEDKGVDLSKDTIAYCRIGERSSHTWFVLHEILEQPNVKNYDGSWTEWGSLVGVPIELGDSPDVRRQDGRALAPRASTSPTRPSCRASSCATASRCRRVRPAARRRRRVHRRGADVGDRAVPVLRRARHLDAAHAGAQGASRSTAPWSRARRGRGGRGARRLSERP